jgi:transcriptional regulator with XRE-family HTH domain
MTHNELKERRAMAGLTQSQTSDTLGIGLRHYQKLEVGTAAITPTMAKLVRLLM